MSLKIPKRNIKFLEMIDEIYTANPSLSTWEMDFLADIQHILNKGWYLSTAQEAKLKTLFDRIGKV